MFLNVIFSVKTYKVAETNFLGFQSESWTSYYQAMTCATHVDVNKNKASDTKSTILQTFRATQGACDNTRTATMRK